MEQNCLRKRVEELGVTLSDQATVEEIRQKEKEYLERRELIEASLESFTRSATSLVYQINKRYLPKNHIKSIDIFKRRC